MTKRGGAGLSASRYSRAARQQAKVQAIERSSAGLARSRYASTANAIEAPTVLDPTAPSFLPSGSNTTHGSRNDVEDEIVRDIKSHAGVHDAADKDVEDKLSASLVIADGPDNCIIQVPGPTNCVDELQHDLNSAQPPDQQRTNATLSVRVASPQSKVSRFASYGIDKPVFIPAVVQHLRKTQTSTSNASNAIVLATQLTPVSPLAEPFLALDLAQFTRPFAPRVPPRRPKACASLFLPKVPIRAPGTITCPVAAVRIVRQLSLDINTSYTELKTIQAKWGLTLRRRWARKKFKDREQLLKKVDGSLADNHFERIKQARICHDFADVRISASHMMHPQMNLQDLLEDMTLQQLFEARTLAHPYAFLRRDAAVLHFGYSAGYLTPDKLNEYVMRFHDGWLDGGYCTIVETTTLSRFVQLGDYEDVPCVAPIGEGYQVLKAQESLYAFLVNWCKKVLHDKCSKSDWLDGPDETSQTGSSASSQIKSTEPAEASSIIQILVNRPYTGPELNLDSIIRIVAVRLDAAQEHARSLREDPAYFSDKAAEWRSNSGIQVVATRAGQPLQANDWAVVLGSLVRTALAEVQLWDTLARLLKDARFWQTCVIAKSLTNPIANMIPAFVRSLSTTLTLASIWWESLVDRMFRGYRQGDETKHSYLYLQRTAEELKAMSTGKVKKYKVSRDRESKFLTRSDELTLWVDILRDREALSVIGFDTAVEYLSMLFEDDAGAHWENPIVTGWTRGCLADLSILTFVITEIIHHPIFASCQLPPVKERVKELDDDVLGAIREEKSFLPLSDPTTQLGTPIQHRFDHPAHRKRTREVVNQLISAEESLDAFWNAFAVDHKDAPAYIRDTLLKIEFHGLERTSPFQDTSTMTINKLKGGDPRDLARSLQAATEATIRKSMEVPVHKIKEKTRGKARADPRDAAHEPQADEPQAFAPPRRVFKLSKKSLRVFRNLFHVPSEKSVPGEIPWRDFLNAMTSSPLDFGAENVYGSAWQFRPPPESGYTQPINFHAPHPAPNMPYRTARRLGRRLRIKYGWDGDCFESA